jgi:hypothetical protein
MRIVIVKDELHLNGTSVLPHKSIGDSVPESCITSLCEGIVGLAKPPFLNSREGHWLDTSEGPGLGAICLGRIG